MYEEAADTDGLRVLVDRIWSRSMTKEHARVDLWFKDIAPSTALRQGFACDPARWNMFKAHYLAIKSITECSTARMNSQTNTAILMA